MTVDIVKPFVDEVVVSNPLPTKAIAHAKVKTDKVDAYVLAQLLRCDYLPRVWEPDETTREIRSLTRRRASLVSDRTGIKNRIHAVLHRRLIHCPVDKLFSKAGLEFLRTLPLDELGRLAVDSDPKLIDTLDAEIAALDAVLARRAWEDERVKLLMTLPGFDITAAQTLLSALGDIHRFPSGDEAASYVGLVPRLRIKATGQRRRGGTPKGSKRPASYGSGQRTRTIPALPDVYQSEGLPAAKSPSPGEKRTLSRDGLTPFVNSLARAHRVPRARQQAPIQS